MKRKKSKGFYILNLNGFTSYVHYNPFNTDFDVIFASKKLICFRGENVFRKYGKNH